MQTVAVAIALVLIDIVHHHLGTLPVEIVAPGIAVSGGRVEQLTLPTLTPGHQQQTAFLVVDDEGLAGIFRLTLGDTLREQAVERRIEAQIVFDNEGSVQLVVEDVLCGQQMFVGTAGSWKQAMHGIGLAIVDEVTVKNLRCQV